VTTPKATGGVKKVKNAAKPKAPKEPKVAKKAAGEHSND
jgi:hypothetical protein